MFETIKISRPQKKVKIHTAVLEPFNDAAGLPARISSPSRGSSREKTSQQTKTIQPLPAVDEEAVREAYNSGIEEGRRRTVELLEEQYALRIQEHCSRIDQLLSEVQQRLQTVTPELEQSLFRFVVGVAEHIIRKEVHTKSEIILSVIKDSVKKIIGVEKVKVRINPAEMKYVRGKKTTIQSVSDSLREITFDADDSVEPGGCIIESDIGNVDARISTQLEQVKDILLKHS